jgi:hypothetical protein
MIADKMARLCHSPTHFDSWLDIAGYARTAVMMLDERERRDQERNTLFPDKVGGFTTIRDLP